MTTEVEQEYRGISKRLALEYLEGMGGERDGDAVEADDWRAEVRERDDVSIGSLDLTPLEVTFEGDEAVLEDVVEEFSQKAMRAGG